MEGTYPLLLGGEAIGKVQVLREGLYLRFFCRCRLTGEVVYRVHAVCGARSENIGVLIPADGGFGLDTRLPAKRFSGMDTPVFRAMPKRPERDAGTFAPIYPEEPFAYLAQLSGARLAVQNGVTGALLPQIDSSSPTGQ